MGAIKGYLTAALPMAAAGASVSGKGAPQGSGVTVPVGQRQILPQVGCCGGERKERGAAPGELDSGSYCGSKTATRPPASPVALGLSFSVCKLETLIFVSQGCPEALIRQM